MREQSHTTLSDPAPVVAFGTPDAETTAQLRRCLAATEAVRGVLCADAHPGYAMPVGGTVAYRGVVPPLGVGYDIGCGVLAVRTDLPYAKITRRAEKLADRLARVVPFAVRRDDDPPDHPLLDDPAWRDHPDLAPLKDLAASQFGTVGSGNHYVDVLVEPDTDAVWVAVHCGSRGLGYRIASAFLDADKGGGFALLPAASERGARYLAAMAFAGRYAAAGREDVISRVLGLLNAEAVDTVQSHHNFAWRETHGGEEVIVVRKGATPAFPGQRGFVGGSMTDTAAVVAGVESERAAAALYSAPHGAGRVMGRSRAAARIDPARMAKAVRAAGVALRGGAVDESPFVYRPLAAVLAAHAETVVVRHTLRPVIVLMAGAADDGATRGPG